METKGSNLLLQADRTTTLCFTAAFDEAFGSDDGAIIAARDAS